MFEMDKEKFGIFVAQLRKEQGMTQKELAQKLYISDKAVSKWETGINTPDVALLIPLSDLLGVTVTELLECKRMDVQPPVEKIVKKAVKYSQNDTLSEVSNGRRIVILLIAVALSIIESVVIVYGTGGYTPELNSVLIMSLLGTVFGVYFWILGRERLPAYYDENRISSYADGFFRMNVPWLTFNNSNWPYIMRVGRLWTVAILDLYPLTFMAGMFLLGDDWLNYGETALMVLYLLGLIVPLYIVGKKYE